MDGPHATESLHGGGYGQGRAVGGTSYPTSPQRSGGLIDTQVGRIHEYNKALMELTRRLDAHVSRLAGSEPEPGGGNGLAKSDPPCAIDALFSALTFTDNLLGQLARQVDRVERL